MSADMRAQRLDRGALDDADQLDAVDGAAVEVRFIDRDFIGDTRVHHEGIVADSARGDIDYHLDVGLRGGEIGRRGRRRITGNTADIFKVKYTVRRRQRIPGRVEGFANARR